jgi:hypothetical protein
MYLILCAICWCNTDIKAVVFQYTNIKKGSRITVYKIIFLNLSVVALCCVDFKVGRSFGDFECSKI